MRLRLLCLGLFLITSTQAFAGGFAIFETSVRVSGMMGAYVADGRDVSTIFFNPAGLAQLSGFQFQTGAVFIAPNTRFRGPYPYSVEETRMDSKTFPIPHLYASYQIMEGLTAGLGVYVPFGLGSKWDRNWVGAGFATETGIQTAVVAPTLAYMLPFKEYGAISLGGSLQIGVLSAATLERRVTDFTTPTNGEPRMIRLEGEGDGLYYGYNVGIIYKPMDKLSVGFSYRSQLELNLVGDATFTNLPESQFIPGAKGDLSITTPANWTVGVSVRPTEDLTLNLDYVNWGWSSYDTLIIDFRPEFETAVLQDSKSPRLYEDVYQIRFGAEYIVRAVQGLTVRGGVGFDKNPVPDETIDPTLPDTDRLIGSLGASYFVTPNVGLNFYYTFIRGFEREATNSENNFRGYYNTFANIYGVGISLTF